MAEQFVFGSAQPIPRGFATERLAGYVLGRHVLPPSVRIVDGQGGALGWFLGYPIDGETLLEHGASIVAESGIDGIESLVACLGGRFLAIVVGVGAARLYLDLCGSLSVVYAPSLALVASTPNLVLYEEGLADRRELVAAMGIPYANAM
jgi:hypothetical protein